MRREVVVRGVAMLVLVVAVAGIAIVLIGGGGGYEVDARFVNAGNLVNGNLVTVSGEQVGKVEDVSLSDDGQAVARLSIDADYAPLREGTRAVVRKRSLSSIANDVIELQLGAGDAANIRAGGTIPAINTESEVPLDEVFNTSIPSPGSPSASRSSCLRTSTSARRTALARRSYTSTPRCRPRAASSQSSTATSPTSSASSPRPPR